MFQKMKTDEYLPKHRLNSKVCLVSTHLIWKTFVKMVSSFPSFGAKKQKKMPTTKIQGTTTNTLENSHVWTPKIMEVNGEKTMFLYDSSLAFFLFRWTQPAGLKMVFQCFSMVGVVFFSTKIKMWGVSENTGGIYPQIIHQKIGCSIIKHHPFWGPIPIFLCTPMVRPLRLGTYTHRWSSQKCQVAGRPLCTWRNSRIPTERYRTEVAETVVLGNGGGK